MSFVQALSGLYGASVGLDVIGNNVANASTVGYKNSRAEFSDIFASYLKTDPGFGVFAPTAAQQFTQGSLQSTNNQLDFSINGNGMFQLSKSAAGSDRIAYTRNGEFHFSPVPTAAGTASAEKYIVNANGNYLTGWANGVDPTTPPSVLKIVDGMASISDLKDILNIDYIDGEEFFQTVNGFLMYLIKSLPKKGQKIEKLKTSNKLFILNKALIIQVSKKNLNSEAILTFKH